MIVTETIGSNLANQARGFVQHEVMSDSVVAGTSRMINEKRDGGIEYCLAALSVNDEARAVDVTHHKQTNSPLVLYTRTFVGLPESQRPRLSRYRTGRCESSMPHTEGQGAGRAWRNMKSYWLPHEQPPESERRKHKQA